MKKISVFWGILLLMLAAAVLYTGSAVGQDDPKPAPCCFNHTGYPNPCKVIPAEDETCDSILEYLNTPGTGGKSYCNGSLLRGDWTAVDCNQEKDKGNGNSARR